MSFREFSRIILAGTANDRRLDNWVVIREVDSSNSLAKRMVAAAVRDGAEPRPAVIVAWEQTAGRGRRRHQWNSPPGLGVYSSLLIPAIPRNRLPVLPLLVAVGLARGLGRHLDSPAGGRRIGLRWPNDLLVEGRKIGGILIEVVPGCHGEPAVVVGYGVNHGQGLESLPAPNATSVALEAQSTPKLPELVVELVSSVIEELEHVEDDRYAVECFSDFLVHRKGDPLRCRTAGGAVEGLFAGLDDRGFLRLRVGGEVTTLAAGEVMESTEPDSSGSASSGDDSDHSYFRAVEEVFIRLRGAPFLLSPEDWRVASGWRREGIPLATVASVLERILGEREETGRGRRSISGLRYFNRPVRAAWTQTQSMLGAEGSRSADPLDVPARLQSLAESVDRSG
ncbi:MAG: biotin--[acetyl-CoA-carboxylase] ligase, partial [Acidobacteriota bacterium]|nr:biotin--[acetyl-CoA-carboxylase] ligase [Acidobacteriota bacterium]